jgi:hypothetical protein
MLVEWRALELLSRQDEQRKLEWEEDQPLNYGETCRKWRHIGQQTTGIHGGIRLNGCLVHFQWLILQIVFRNIKFLQVTDGLHDGMQKG